MISITKDEDKVPYWFSELESHRLFQTRLEAIAFPAYPETELELIQEYDPPTIACSICGVDWISNVNYSCDCMS